MEHDIYENQMIDGVNRNAEEKSQAIDALKNATQKSSTSGERNAQIVRRGLKRILLALMTAAMFVISVVGFIAVATAPGYLAVLLFFASVATLGCVFILLYAQGIGHVTIGGDPK